MERMSDGHRVFAFAYSWFARLGDKGEMGELRTDLVGRSFGTVVEIGAGTGLNFHHYPEGVEVFATEPDRHMFRRAEKAAARTNGAVTLKRAPAESLPFPDESVDVVVSTLVLCSVRDQAVTLAEVRRVLRPGGALLLLEHVRSQDPAMAAKQDKREPSHVRFAGGCHPNRDTLAAVATADFDISDVNRIELPGFKMTRSAIMGAARKPTP
jgi:ubiquinone/menaquinone biosynthesis C-methylase UbiE